MDQVFKSGLLCEIWFKLWFTKMNSKLFYKKVPLYCAMRMYIKISFANIFQAFFKKLNSENYWLHFINCFYKQPIFIRFIFFKFKFFHNIFYILW
jgi:hypothetical protein